MKTLIFNLKAALGALFFLLVFTGANAQSQTGLGLPGDNLNLSAVLDIFQRSKTLEEFERTLNSDSYKVNNLDLNYDGQTDYIKVNDFPDGKLHSIVLQIDVNQNESQDVAVIYTEKKRNGDVDVQIVGDESLYGKDYVIDLGDNQNGNTPNPAYNGNVVYDDGYNSGYNNYVAPARWNVILYMYGASYTPWYSPWYWGYYPRFWNPWRPFFWSDYNYHCYNRYPWHYRNYYYGHRNRFHNHHSHWYGRNRHRSDVFHNNRDRGVYTKTYQGVPPVKRPSAGRAITQNGMRQQDVISNPTGRDRTIQTKPGTTIRNDRNTNTAPGIRSGSKPTERAQSPLQRPSERLNRADVMPQQQIRQNQRPAERTQRPVERPAERMNRPEVRPQQQFRQDTRPMERTQRPVEQSTQRLNRPQYQPQQQMPRPVERTQRPADRQAERMQPRSTERPVMRQERPVQQTRPERPMQQMRQERPMQQMRQEARPMPQRNESRSGNMRPERRPGR